MTVKEIKQMIEEVTQIPFDKISGESRKSPYALSRILFIHECLEINMTTVAIGNLINRSHSTVIHYAKKYDDLLCFDKYFKSLVEAVKDWKKRNE